MDKKAVDLILVRPTRTGVEKLGKEIVRLRGIAETRATEMQTWKDAVTVRNETIKDLTVAFDDQKVELKRVYHELQESANIVSEEKKQDALRVEELRAAVQAISSAAAGVANRLIGIVSSIEQTEDLARDTRDSIAGNQMIEYTKELSHETDNAAK